MAERIDRGAHDLPWPGTRAATGTPAPGLGTWEIIDHDGCAGRGHLRELGRGDPVPGCPVCGAWVNWQLSHLSTSVAADHRGAGPLP
jgi:hypothetical protein